MLFRSSGLGTLAQAAKGQELGARTLRLRSPRRHVQRVLETSGITAMLPIVPTDAEAPEVAERPGS